MGKALIIENLKYGLYNITRTYKTDYVDLIKKIGERLVKIEARLLELAGKVVVGQATIASLQSQLSVAGGAHPIDKAKVTKLTGDIEKALNDVAALNRNIVSEGSKKLGMQEQLVTVKADQAEAAKIKTVWCTAYYDLLSGNVDTIEIDNQAAIMLIAPAGVASAPGILKRTDMGTPAEAFYNCAMLPGVQKWKPRYKFAMVTSVDKVLNTCSVAFEEMSLTGRDTLANKTMTEVPIDYMRCNAAVFYVGSEVVVEFTGRDRTKPRVIGFQSNPLPCLPLLLVQVHAAGYNDYVIIWNMLTNEYYDITTSPASDFPCPASLVASYRASKTEIGLNLLTAVDAGFSIEDWTGLDSDCHIVTPSNSTCHKSTQMPGTIPGPDGVYNLMNTREVYRIGGYAINWYDEYHYIYDVIPMARRRDLQPADISYASKLYILYDTPFPSKKITALNRSGYVGSVGTRFATGRKVGSPLVEERYPWIFRYSNYYGNTRYIESCTKQYTVTTPLGEMMNEERINNWTQYAGGATDYSYSSYDKAQGLAGGQYTESVFTQFYLMQYVNRTRTKTRSGSESVIDAPRVVIAHAQAILAPLGQEAGPTTSPYNSLGRNTALEAAIEELVAAWYSGNGLLANSLINIDVEWKLIS